MKRTCSILILLIVFIGMLSSCTIPNDIPTEGMFYCEELKMVLNFSDERASFYIKDGVKIPLKVLWKQGKWGISINEYDPLDNMFRHDESILSGDFRYKEGIVKVKSYADDQTYIFLPIEASECSEIESLCTIPEEEPTEGMFYCKELQMVLNYSDRSLSFHIKDGVKIPLTFFSEYWDISIVEPTLIVFSKDKTILEGSFKYSEGNVKIRSNQDGQIYIFLPIESSECSEIESLLTFGSTDSSELESVSTSEPTDCWETESFSMFEPTDCTAVESFSNFFEETSSH